MEKAGLKFAVKAECCGIEFELKSLKLCDRSKIWRTGGVKLANSGGK